MNIGRTLKNVGSKATDSATSKAQRVAMGGNHTTISQPISTTPPVIKRRIHPGSAAGLKNQKKVYLNMEGTGYLNPDNQTARNTKRTIIKPNINVMTSSGFLPRNKTFDMRTFGSNCGSVKMLRERL